MRLVSPQPALLLLLPVLLLLCLDCAGSSAAAPPDVSDRVDYARLLARSDLLWRWEWPSADGLLPALLKMREGAACALPADTGCCVVRGSGGAVEIGPCKGAGEALKKEKEKTPRHQNNNNNNDNDDHLYKNKDIIHSDHSGHSGYSGHSDAPPPPPPPPPPADGRVWLFSAEGLIVAGDAGDGGKVCLSATAPASLLPCNASDSRQVWREYFGFYNASSLCLSPLLLQPYCNGTYCPQDRVRPVQPGTPVGAVACGLGGEQEQYFETVLTKTGASNLQPDSWATAALSGNGLLGVRVQAVQGAPGLLQVTMDNNNLGRGAQRLPVGSFFFNFTSLYAPGSGSSLVVSMRQSLLNASITANVSTSAAPDQVLATLHLFVHANRSLPVVVATVGSAAGPIAFAWQTQPAPGATTYRTFRDGVWLAGQNISGGADYVAAWRNVSSADGRSTTLFASVVQSAQPQSDAIAVLGAAVALGRATLYAAHCAWWQREFWPAAVVSFGATFVENYYSLALSHYAMAEQVGIHGLDGAFGPTDMCNYWADDVWDMNEEVGVGVGWGKGLARRRVGPCTLCTN